MSQAADLQLLIGGTTNGAWMPWPGGRGQFDVSCLNYAGAIVRLEVRSRDKSTGIPVDTVNLSFAGNGMYGFGPLGAGTLIRAAVIGTPLAGVYAGAAVVDSTEKAGPAL